MTPDSRAVKDQRTRGTLMAKAKKKVVRRASARAGESEKAASPLRAKSKSQPDPRSGRPGAIQPGEQPAFRRTNLGHPVSFG